MRLLCRLLLRPGASPPSFFFVFQTRPASSRVSPIRSAMGPTSMFESFPPRRRSGELKWQRTDSSQLMRYSPRPSRKAPHCRLWSLRDRKIYSPQATFCATSGYLWVLRLTYEALHHIRALLTFASRHHPCPPRRRSRWSPLPLCPKGNLPRPHFQKLLHRTRPILKQPLRNE